MEIIYHGDSSYLLKAEQTVVINPPNRAAAGQIVLHSRRQNDWRQLVDGPGEYEIAGVMIGTIETGKGDAAALTHAIDIGGINVVHVGSPFPELLPQDIATLGAVDILLLSVEDLRAAEAVVRDLEPRVVIPSGTRVVELCAALGAPGLQPEARFSWNGTGTPPKVVLLKAPAKRTRAA